MKAWVLHGIGDIRMEERELPVISEGEALVRVAACGICGSDIPRIYTTGAHVHPIIPGHEFAGTVEKVYSDKDSMWINKRVSVFPLIPCRECKPCLKKKYEMCKNYNYLGSRCDGGFAEYVKVPVANLIELPDTTSLEVGAMMEPMAVAVHSIRQIGIDNNGYALVSGFGTIGYFVVMMLLGMGQEKVIVIGKGKAQKDRFDELCTSYINESGFNIIFIDCIEGDNIKEKLSEYEVTSAYECVGTNKSLENCINSLGPSGKMVTVGNPHSDMALEKNVYWKILRSQLEIHGTWNSSFTGENDDDWHYIIKLLKDEKIQPEKIITHRMRVSELENGFFIMRDKLESYGKVMMKI
ncbi:MAG: galactitol-1-phosphate 5-dehydrogenase [Butyrivibrio sp.]|nr:galactitol-1-phosphate 5-dehydrogenase [Butyrivibrio sp.]